jgi:dethiobiotin synthetase
MSDGVKIRNAHPPRGVHRSKANGIFDRPAHDRPRTQHPEAQRPRGLFVTGTDTGVGKTVLSAALLAAMAAAGEPVRAHKPVVTGLGEGPTSGQHSAWPPDHELLGSAANMTGEEVAPLRYAPAVSPHLAAQLAGERIEAARLLTAARSATTVDDILIVEGVGGLLVPLADDYSVRDFAVALGLPLLIAARPGLGTINHTLLTLDAARAAGLDVLAVVLTPWPKQPNAMQRSNRETIARLDEIEVVGLGPVRSSAAADLASAGDALPWRRWLAPESPILSAKVPRRSEPVRNLRNSSVNIL